MADIDFSKVGLKMKQLRMEKGITQEQIAENLECTVSFISNVENNRVKMNLRILLYYASLCDVSIDTLLNAGKPESYSSTDDMIVNTELQNILNRFTLEERKKIVKMLRIWRPE